ncbi:pyridine nucleotide-disulfide oxidoreductase-domain-containing protein [Chytridium lagenaria]|nr:pyridine nucleotide-disulfide oxidoreductase-domain-containing protein [Chytridium lagenaria]
MASILGKPKGRIVVLGTGWRDFELREGLIQRPRNHLSLHLLLASASVGTLEFRCVVEPLKQHAPHVEFYEANCKSIDWKNKVLQCASTLRGGDEFQVAYDSLVIAAGAVSNTFNIKGAQEHACFLKDIKDARKIRTRIMECFELASQPNKTETQKRDILHFAVVGGGPTGVEFMAELHDFVTEDVLAHYPNLKPFVTMTIYDVGKSILNAFDATLGDYAATRFKRKGIKLKLNTGVKEVSSDHIILSDDRKVPYGLLVWSTGLAPIDLTLTDEYFRVLEPSGEVINDVYALGDCATVQGTSLPCTAQAANQKATWLVKALNEIGRKYPDEESNTALKRVEPFNYKHQGSLAYLGKWKAIADLKPPASKRSISFIPSTGVGAWLFWRSAYFTMSVSMKNKVLIPMFWFLTWIFGRDTSRFP